MLLGNWVIMSTVTTVLLGFVFFIAMLYDKSELFNVFKAFLDKYKKEWGKFGVEVPIPNCLL